MTIPTSTDTLRAFTTALTPAARSHLRHVAGYDQVRLITKACETTTPQQLAKTVSAGIGYRYPANAAGLIRYRLERAAGEHNDEQEAPA